MLPTSELDAVNQMLSAIGEDEIDNFNQSFADAATARDLLHQELRALENGTWTFNTDIGVVINPDTNGFLNLQQNTLRVYNIRRVCSTPNQPAPAVQPFDYHTNDRVVQRGQRLYDRRLQTFQFSVPVQCDMTMGLQFDDCPEAVRRLTLVRAARKFQDRLQADTSLHGFQMMDEKTAWVAFLNFEHEAADWNMLHYSGLSKRMKANRWGSNTGIGGDYMRYAGYGIE